MGGKKYEIVVAIKTYEVAKINKPHASLEINLATNNEIIIWKIKFQKQKFYFPFYVHKRCVNTLFFNFF